MEQLGVFLGALSLSAGAWVLVETARLKVDDTWRLLNEARLLEDETRVLIEDTSPTIDDARMLEEGNALLLGGSSPPAEDGRRAPTLRPPDGAARNSIRCTRPQ